MLILYVSERVSRADVGYWTVQAPTQASPVLSVEQPIETAQEATNDQQVLGDAPTSAVSRDAVSLLRPAWVSEVLSQTLLC